MLVLDTNVISEALKPEPNAKVRAWLEVQPAASVFTTAISQAEILYGVALLPKGRRQSILLTAAVSMFEEDFRGRVLPFDSEVARIYTSLASARRQDGLPISFADAQRVVTQSRGGRLATRNVRDFAGCGIEIVYPWDA